MPDPLFQTLLDDTASTSWAPSGAVRDRARQRARRQRFATVAAAIVIAAGIGVTAVVVTRTDAVGPQPAESTSATPSPTPATGLGTQTPSTSAPSGSNTSAGPPEPTALVNELFLQPSDVGSGYQVVSPDGGSGDWTFEFSAAAIRCQKSASYPNQLVRRDWLLTRGAPTDDDGVSQYVTRYRSGDAARYFTLVRSVVAGCNPGAGKSMTIVAQRFAGQDALLVEVNYGEGNTAKHILVRQGDLVTQIYAKQDRSRAASQDLGKKAAARLCGGTPVC
jgi:hypothetical protein